MAIKDPQEPFTRITAGEAELYNLEGGTRAWAKAGHELEM